MSFFLPKRNCRHVLSFRIGNYSSGAYWKSDLLVSNKSYCSDFSKLPCLDPSFLWWILASRTAVPAPALNQCPSGRGHTASGPRDGDGDCPAELCVTDACTEGRIWYKATREEEFWVIWEIYQVTHNICCKFNLISKFGLIGIKTKIIRITILLRLQMNFLINISYWLHVEIINILLWGVNKTYYKNYIIYLKTFLIKCFLLRNYRFTSSCKK